MLPAAADLVPGIVCVNPPFRSSSGCGNSHLSSKVAKVSRSQGLKTISESHSEAQQPEQTETATNYEYFDCLGSSHIFCCEMKVAENLCKLLTSNRCRTTFFKCMSLKSVTGTVPLISEMTELSGAGCRCRCPAVVWI